MLGLIPPVVVGIALRWIHLGAQIPTGDELHSINGALVRPLSEILQNWTYHGADYCVPLTALYRVLMDAGIVLSEMGFRTPVLLSGVVALVAIPLACAPRIGRRAALVLAWLLAISPMLVLYSRIIRSYMPMTLLALAAVWAFERWWRTRRWSFALAYAGLSAAAVYFHLGAAPLVLSPFVYAAAATVLGHGRPRSDLGPLAVLFLATGVLIALPLFPARASLAELIGIHGRGYFPDPTTWFELVRLQSGTSSLLLTALLAGALVRGALELYRRDRPFLLYLLTLGIGHIVGLAILSPNHLQNLVVANRYLLPLLPLALALAALGLAAPWSSRGPRWLRRAPAVVSTLLVAALVLFGPLVGRHFRTSSFVHSRAAVFFTSSGNTVPPDRIPRFYFDVSVDGDVSVDARERDIVLLEYPWLNLGAHIFDAYQKVHRREIRVGSLNRRHSEDTVAFLNMIEPTPEAFLASDAHYLVLHTDIRSEADHLQSSDIYHQVRLTQLPQLWSALRSGAGLMEERLVARWGAPMLAEGPIRVWDLEALRRRR